MTNAAKKAVDQRIALPEGQLDISYTEAIEKTAFTPNSAEDDLYDVHDMLAAMPKEALRDPAHLAQRLSKRGYALVPISNEAPPPAPKGWQFMGLDLSSQGGQKVLDELEAQWKQAWLAGYRAAKGPDTPG